MQRVGRRCAICRDEVQTDWSASSCAPCDRVVHTACCLRVETSAGYRERATGTCPSCAGPLERHSPDPEAADDASWRSSALAIAFCTLILVGLLASGLLVVFGLDVLRWSLFETHPFSYAGSSAPFAMLTTGGAGLVTSVLAMRTPRDQMRFAPQESRSRRREPVP